MPRRWTLAAVAAVAAEERTELGVQPRSAIDPYELAEQHGVDCYDIDQLSGDLRADATIDYLLTTGQAAWSALLVPIGTARIILENPTHTVQRRRFSVAHELGHFLLEHDFAASVVTAEGGREWDPTKEKHADHFACQLLVPDDDAVWAGFRDFTNADVADHFNVSEQVASWRMGRARIIVRRSRGKS